MLAFVVYSRCRLSQVRFRESENRQLLVILLMVINGYFSIVAALALGWLESRVTANLALARCQL